MSLVAGPVFTPALALFLLAAAGFQAPLPQAPLPPHALEVANRAPRHQLSLEIFPIAAHVGYAARVAPNTSVGLKLGLGIDFLSEVPFAGGHFTGDWGVAYEQRDGYTDKRYLEFAHLALFVRRFLPHRFHIELGARASNGFHLDSSDDDEAPTRFVGAYLAAFWGGSILSVGSRISLGSLSESQLGIERERELALVLNPIIVKLTTR
ncbi:MAG TPA: hypothetical protein VGF45_04285 [Polyangia bacterium]